MLTISHVITLPSVSYGYSELYCRSGAQSVASQKSGATERERSGVRGYKNKLEREAGLSLLTLLSHDLFLYTYVIQFTEAYFYIWHVGCRVRRICSGALSACVQ